MTLIGLYSPFPQSGKSTVTGMIARKRTVQVFKISGLMKTMTQAALNSLVDPIDSYVDGKEKDSPIPTLTIQHISQRIDSMLNAFHLSIGSNTVQTRNGPRTRNDLKHDLHTTFLNALRVILETRPLTSRDLQKVLGLEWGRKLYGDDFWLTMLAKEMENVKADVCIIDDVRFPDDAAFVANRKGLVGRIFKPDAKNPDAHASEGLLENYPFDFRIDNIGTLDDLKKIVEKSLLSIL